jgi:alkylhydroperoxidase family enzyme
MAVDHLIMSMAQDYQREPRHAPPSGPQRSPTRPESPSRIEEHRVAIRVVLASLGLVQLVNGFWALFAPNSFYTQFPVGRGWVQLLPAYNEHLTRDVGALFLATGVILLAAAWLLERRVVLVASVGFLVFAVPHAIYHLLNLGAFGTADAIANGLLLGASVLLPAWVTWVLCTGSRGRRVRSEAAMSNGSEAEGSERRARIKLVADGEGGLLAWLAFRESRRRFGQVMDPMRVMAHHPTILVGAAAMETASQRATLVSSRLKHLAEMRAGMIAGCEWCLDFGSALSPEMGVTETDLRELPTYELSDHFNEIEKLVLDYATAMSRSPVEVSDQLFDELSRHLDEAQLVELTSIIALESYRARFNWAFGLEGQGFSEGAFCVLPETRQEVQGHRRFATAEAMDAADR